jgi:hypothetical protein
MPVRWCFGTSWPDNPSSLRRSIQSYMCDTVVVALRGMCWSIHSPGKDHTTSWLRSNSEITHCGVNLDTTRVRWLPTEDSHLQSQQSSCKSYKNVNERRCRPDPCALTNLKKWCQTWCQ